MLITKNEFEILLFSSTIAYNYFKKKVDKFFKKKIVQTLIVYNLSKKQDMILNFY